MSILININPEKWGLQWRYHSHKSISFFLICIFFLSVSSISANLFVVLLECCKILMGLWEFTLQIQMLVFASVVRIKGAYLLHTLADIPGNEGALSVTIHTDSFLFFSHLLHFWLIAPMITPLWLIYPYCTVTIYTARYPPITLAWSYSNIPEF